MPGWSWTLMNLQITRYGKKWAGVGQQERSYAKSCGFQKLKKTWKETLKKRFLWHLSTLSWKNVVLRIFDFSDFWIPHLDAQMFVLAPRMRYPGIGFWVTENCLKTWKTWFVQFFSSPNVDFSKAFAEKTKKWKLFSYRFLFLSVYFQKQKYKIF